MRQRILLLLSIGFFLSVLCAEAQNNTFPSSGNVGIGTASPSNPLDIQVFNSSLYSSTTAPATFLRLFNRNTGATGLSAAINFITRANDQTGQSFNIGVVSSTGGYSPNLIFQSQTGSSTYIERMRIDTNGNVGIGTSTPAYPLDVNGAIHSYINSGSNLFLSKPSGASIAFDNGSGSITSLIESGSPLVGNRLEFWTNTSTNSGLVERMRIDDQGNVGIGTTYTGPYKLAVEGTVGVRKLKVTQVSPWADFVFDPSYELKPLSQVESFIKKNKHLPEVPSAKEIEKNGIDVGETAALLLKKIEELTLHIIELEKRIKTIENKK